MQFLTHIFAVGPGQPCDPDGGGLLGFPHWYKYLHGIGAPNGISGGGSATLRYTCVPQIGNLSDVWLIVAAVVEILLRLAALAAIVFVVYGGVQLITAQGDPSGSKKARQTITNALVGLVIAIAATTIISFIAGQFK